MTTAQAMTTTTMTGQKTTGRATMMATEMVWMTETMTRVMDEPIAPSRRSGGLTARSRIVGWLLLLAAVALTANLAISARVLLSQVGDRIDAELAHETDKARDWIARERDPVTNAAFSSATELFRRYLETTLPEEGETYFSVVAGDAAHRARAEPQARLDLDEDFLAMAGSVTNEPRRGVWHSPDGGAHYAVLPVAVTTTSGADSTGALVVVEFDAAERAETFQTLRVLGVVSVVALVAAGVVSWLVAGRLLAPIRSVRRTAESISETDLAGRIEVRGDDDVAELARTFNHMLDRLERAFTMQRRPLDDAGHELRTPLTVVRGHLELMSEDPADRTATLDLVNDELRRMSRIVDDLMVLARSEHPDFLAVGEVDLADLTLDVAAKAPALGDRRWTVSEVADGAVAADGQRLTQALMQLASNAVRHTKPGDRIGFGSAIRGDRALLWVHDTGAGIARDEQQDIFERFAGASNSTSSQGTGLGLAIVKSIAEAHDGRVLVDSRIGRGARFTLEIPLVTPATRRSDSVTPALIPVPSEAPR